MLNKKVCAVIMASAMTAALLAGCGSSDSASETTSEAVTETSTEAATEETETKTYAADAYLSGITASDYVELPDLSNITVAVDDPREDITDEYVDSYIQDQLENSAELVEITEREVAADGDIANIDYVGKLDGEAFDGGTASGYDLELGSGSFIDGFEDGVIGMKVGETKTLTLTFPENYSNSDLAGQETTFDVTLNSIQEYQAPELTEEWIAEQDIEGVKTVDEYKAYIKEQLLEDAETSYNNAIQESVGEYVYNNATWLQDPPADLVDRLYDQFMSTYETYASYYGTDVDTFLDTIGADKDELRNSASENAQYYICMQAVADAEGLNLTDEQYEEQAAEMATSYGYDDVATFEESVGKNEISEYLTMSNVLQNLASNATVTAETEDAAETSTEASTEAATEAATEGATEAAAE